MERTEMSQFHQVRRYKSECRKSEHSRGKLWTPRSMLADLHKGSTPISTALYNVLRTMVNLPATSTDSDRCQAIRAVSTLGSSTDQIQATTTFDVAAKPICWTTACSVIGQESAMSKIFAH